MSSARDEVLARIRKSLGNPSAPAANYRDHIPRDFHVSGELGTEERIDLLIDRLQDYGARVHRCRREEIAAAVGRILQERGKSGLLIPAGLDSDWLPAGYTFLKDVELSYDEIDRTEGVLTGCAVAIALTGSIVLRHSREEGRRAASLIPDYHLCVVFEDQVLETVPEAMGFMRSFAQSAITTIAGPSATADIEMTRVKGVHGPRTLEVILAR